MGRNSEKSNVAIAILENLLALKKIINPISHINWSYITENKEHQKVNRVLLKQICTLYTPVKLYKIRITTSYSKSTRFKISSPKFVTSDLK